MSLKKSVFLYFFHFISWHDIIRGKQFEKGFYFNKKPAKATHVAPAGGDL